jgi:hypothetical protein
MRRKSAGFEGSRLEGEIASCLAMTQEDLGYIIGKYYIGFGILLVNSF